MKDHTKKLIVPDGGWGWFVCLGSSFITLSLRSLDPSFGLLFQDLLEKLDIASTGASFITSIMEANVNFSGLFVGPLIKKYTYRNVAIFGSLLSCIGLILTSQSNSMIHIICTYSILGGLGTGFATAAAFVALNNYFDKKRGQAVGLSMAGTTIAMTFMPQLIHVLLTTYGFRGTVLIIGALALHSVVGACLLQPVDRHMKKVPSKEEPASSPENEALLEQNGKTRNNVSKEMEIELKTTLALTVVRIEEINSNVDRQRRESIATISSMASVLDLNCINVSDVKSRELHEKEENEKADESSKEKETTILQRIINFFDLDLLKNYVYLNITIGLSLYFVTEVNFKLMTSFFLSSIGMEQKDVAFCLSVTFFSDIVARVILPPLFDKFQFRKRTLFWICSMSVGIGRSVLVEQTKGTMLMVVLVVIGFLRGATLVNFNLTVSENCTLDKLPAAFGIFMVLKGVFVAILGPVIGLIRDYSGSYKLCSHAMTGMISVCFFAWGIEFALKRIRARSTFKSTANVVASSEKSAL